MRVTSSFAVGLLLSASMATAAVSYNLTNAAYTSVKYEAKESAVNSTAANSIVRSIGLLADPTFGLLSDATLTTVNGSGAAFVSPNTNPHGILDVNNFITQGGGTNKSTLDLTFNAGPGQWFTSGDFRVNYAVYNNLPSLWDIGIDYIGWQVSTDGGSTFTDIFRAYTVDTEPAGTKRYDTGVLPVPGIAGCSSIIIRGVADSSGGTRTTSTNSHWYLLATPPFTTGTFNGGLELNLASVPEPAGLVLLLAGGLFANRRRPH